MKVPLDKRMPLFPESHRMRYGIARGFYAPQRPHIKQPMPENPNIVVMSENSDKIEAQ